MRSTALTSGIGSSWTRPLATSRRPASSPRGSPSAADSLVPTHHCLSTEPQEASVIDWAGRLTPFPDDFVKTYRSAGLWGTLPIGAEFHEVATRRSSHPAVVTEDGSLTYGQLDTASDRLAVGLADLGLVPGDRVIVQLTNRLHSVVAWY